MLGLLELSWWRAGRIRNYLIDVHRPVGARLVALSFLEMFGVIELSSWWDSFRLAHMQTTENTLDRTGNDSIIKYHKWIVRMATDVSIVC